MDAGGKRKHKTLPLKTKLEILRRIDKGETIVDLGKMYGVGRTTIHDIRKRRSKLERYVNETGDNSSQRRTLRLQHYPELDEELFKWFAAEPARYTAVTGPMIREKAISLYKSIYNKDEGFRASSGWLYRFKERLDLRMSLLNRKSPVSLQSIVQEIKQAMESYGLVMDQVYNAGEDELLWKLPPGRCAEVTGERSPLKDKVTFVACANATGTHKLNLLCVGKTKEQTALKDLRPPVHYVYQKNGCFTAEVLKKWFHEIFVPQVKEASGERDVKPKALLILDNALDPGCPLKTNDGLIKVMFRSLNSTRSQPVDENLTKLVKAQYKKKTVVSALVLECSITHKFKRMTLKDALATAAEAWQSVPAVAIESSWKRLEITDTAIDEQDEYEPEVLIPITDVIRSITEKTPTEFTSQELVAWFSGAAEENRLNDEVEVKHEVLVEDRKSSS